MKRPFTDMLNTMEDKHNKLVIIGNWHPFAGVELVPSSKRSVCHLYFNLVPLLIFYVDPG
jgi:hypothetical protein